MSEIYRKIYGVRFSANYGDTFRIVAICEVCLKKVEPPARVKNEGESGVASCDWCRAKNVMYQPKSVLPSPSDFALEWLTENDPDYDDYNDLPLDRVNLSENFSPVIVSSGDDYGDAVAVEKINEFTYRLLMSGGTRNVPPDDLKRMRARYLLKSGRKGS